MAYKIVIPGDILAEGLGYIAGQGTHRVGNEIRSSILGILNQQGKVIKVIPLRGAYIPKEGDKVIGQITDVGYSVWEVDVNGPTVALLSITDVKRYYIELGEDLSKYFDIGDYIYAEIERVGKSMFVKLKMDNKMYRKLDTGMVLKVSPVKIPRIIGKKGSMINLLKEMIGCSIIVGQNGLIWIKGKTGKEELVAMKAIKYIEENALKEGLTDEIKEKIKEWMQNE